MLFIILYSKECRGVNWPIEVLAFSAAFAESIKVADGGVPKHPPINKIELNKVVFNNNDQ